MKKRRLIPFNWLPGAWGLKGQTRVKAELEYYYEGYDLELEMLKLDYGALELKAEINHLDFKHHLISNRQYEANNIELIVDETERELARLAHDKKYNNLTENEYNKQSATLKGEPWVVILNTNVNIDDPAQGELELDWNDKFIELLDNKGFVAKSADESVNMWLSTLCKNIAMEEFAGVGTVADDLESGYNIKRQQIDKGKWEAK